jgi:iron complex transport system substrate-binding protein
MLSKIIRHLLPAALAASLSLSLPAWAETITVTDMAGRTVEVPHGAERIVLGEGRMMYAVAPLMTDDPFARILGWKDDLILYDPDAFRKFEAKFPKDTARLINFGNPYSGDFSIETALANKVDLVVLDLGSLFKAEESGVIDNLEKAGVPVIFIDFRQNPTENTVPSMLLLGRVLKAEERAAEFIDYYIAEMRKVSNVVQSLPAEDRPKVFVENAAGYEPGFCCTTFGPFNYGRYVDLAGGDNYGSALTRAYQTEVSLEGVIASDPDVIIATGANWAESDPGVTAVPLGYDATPEVAAEKLAGLMARDGFKDMRAVQDGRYMVIYHQFYNSPYHFVALQQLARWLHGDAFAALDPQATWVEFHQRFMPFEASGVFWAAPAQ